jgi:hypothetical protein
MKFFNENGDLVVNKNSIFDEDGCLLFEVELEVKKITNNEKLHYNCDAVRLKFACLYAGETHGNYDEKTLYLRVFGS